MAQDPNLLLWQNEVRRLSDIFIALQDEPQQDVLTPVVQTKIDNTSSFGRPRIEVPMELIHGLFLAGYKQTDIVAMAGISRPTLQRRIKEWPVPQMNNDQLDTQLARLIDDFPKAGIRLLQGVFRSNGFKTTRPRLQQALMRVDPMGTLDRTIVRIPRTVVRYWVPWPNAVWHFDGHEKLKRWFVWIHGCVDGYSRRIVYLQARGNKKASTVREIFTRATRLFGAFPQRVRCDKGRENVGVMFIMHIVNAHVSKPVLSGRSVHNTRIERLWREVHRVIGFRFKRLFDYLEATGNLDIDDCLDIWCLHQIFLPIINRALEQFQRAWDYHRSSSAHEKSPLRQYIDGMARHPDITAIAAHAGEIPDDQYAVDEEVEDPRELGAQEVDANDMMSPTCGIPTLDQLEHLADEELAGRSVTAAPTTVELEGAAEGAEMHAVLQSFLVQITNEGDDNQALRVYVGLRNCLKQRLELQEQP